MLDLRTWWLTRPEDRYEATPLFRRAERAVYPYLLLPRPRVRPSTQTLVEAATA